MVSPLQVIGIRVTQLSPLQVMALLVCLSAAFFDLKVNAHSWLGIGIILTSTHLYMNIAIRR